MNPSFKAHALQQGPNPHAAHCEHHVECHQEHVVSHGTAQFVLGSNELLAARAELFIPLHDLLRRLCAALPLAEDREQEAPPSSLASGWLNTPEARTRAMPWYDGHGSSTGKEPGTQRGPWKALRPAPRCAGRGEIFCTCRRALGCLLCRSCEMGHGRKVHTHRGSSIMNSNTRA